MSPVATGPNHARFLAKPYSVQRLMRTWLVQRNLDQDEREYFQRSNSETVFAEALEWWRDQSEKSRMLTNMSEEEFAVWSLNHMRSNPDFRRALEELERVEGATVTLFPRSKR